MKKVLLVLFVLLSLTACNKKFSKGEVVTAYADEVLEKLENKESFIVYVGYDDCQSCKEFKPILNQLIENYDITINAIKLNNYQLNIHHTDTITYTKEIIKNVYIKKKQNHFTHGISLGFGYGFINRKPDLFLGYSIQYNF